MLLILANIDKQSRQLRCYMGIVLIHLFLLKHPRFILYLDDLKKKRKMPLAMNISISLAGRLYVTGGEVDILISSSQVDVVDLSSGETSRGPSMRNPRYWHAAAASPTSLFVFGGLATEISVEVFNPQTRQ